MNIAIATDKFQYSGGMERYVFDLVQGFLSKQITPTVLTMKSSPEFTALCPTQTLGQFPIAQLRYAVFNAKVQKRLPENHQLIATSLVDNADILICGGNHIGFLTATNRQATIKDRMTIRRGFSAYQTAKKIVTHSKKMADELQQFYHIDPKKIITIYPPVDSEKFYPLSNKERQNLRQKFGFKDNENILLFPSGDHERKGLPLILDCLKNIQSQLNIPIKIAVCGTKSVQNENVINLGFVKNMPELYNAVDFSILASNYEPFGLVGVESILCGIKIIFADNCGCCEVIKNTDNLFFNIRQPETLINSLKLADKMKQENNHKINNLISSDEILYNLKLSHHIDKLLEII
ncbi:MAG: glycosyltransferase family 4 protein [Neisseriaceae bacterium]|nr:glycosyltransferase family 4 protein [Neisseriaceae bacterium]